MYMLMALVWEMFLFHPVSSEEAFKYQVSKDGSGNPVCSVEPPDRTIHRIRSAIVCSGFCCLDPGCSEFNFNLNTGVCQLFNESSTVEDVSIPNCRHYTKQRMEKLTSTTDATITTTSTTITLQSRPATTTSSTSSSTSAQSNSVITNAATTNFSASTATIPSSTLKTTRAAAATTSLIQTTESTTTTNVQSTAKTIGLTTTSTVDQTTAATTTTPITTKAHIIATTTTASTTTIPSMISSTKVSAIATTTVPYSTSKTTSSTAAKAMSVMQTTKAATIKTTARASAQGTGPTGLPYPTSELVPQPSSSILIQNNVNTLNAFNRPWLDFKNGFGDSNGNYWLGNDAIHNYLAGHTYQLYVYVYPVYAVYPYLAIYQWYFAVGDSTSNYLLGVSMSGGNATSDGLGVMVNSMFSTSDKDNDFDPHNCAATYGAGWWYGGDPLSNGYACGTTMLNGCGNNFVWEQDTTLTLRASQMWMVY